MSNLARPVRLLLLLVVGLLVLTHSERPGHSAPFTVNPGRVDPYKNFKFRVKWDGHYVYGVSHVSPLHRSTEVVEYRDGGDLSTVRRAPGVTHFVPITMKRGVTHDTDFEKWANKVWNSESGSGREVSLKDFRKDVVIELHNEAGQVVMAHKVFRCWVSEYEAWSELDANGTTILMEAITLQHEGWQRDRDVVEPAEPSVR